MTRNRIFLVLAALLGALELWRVLHTFGEHPPSGLGWDFIPLCDAADLLRHGGNPYVADNLAHHFLSYPYLPTIAWLFAPACAVIPQGSPLIGGLELLVLAASALALGRGLGLAWPEAALLALLAPGAFDAGTWIVLTGNAAILEAPLMAAALIAYHRGRTTGAGALLGGLASIKMLPLAWLLGFPLLLPPTRAWRPVLAGLAVFGLMLGFGLLLAGDLRHSMGALLLGEIPTGHTPFREVLQGPSDPNLPDFLLRLSAAVGVVHRGPPITTMALLFLVAGFVLARLRTQPGVAPFAIVLIVIALALFRLKPYAYTSLTLLALAACVEAGRIRSARLLGVAAAAAVARLLLYVPIVGRVFSDYYQLVAVLAATAAVTMLLSRRARRAGFAAAPRPLSAPA